MTTSTAAAGGAAPATTNTHHHHHTVVASSQPSTMTTTTAASGATPSELATISEQVNNVHVKSEAIKAPIATVESTKPLGNVAATTNKASDVNKENIPTAATAAASRFQKSAAVTAPYIELNNVPINGVVQQPPSTSPAPSTQLPISVNNNAGVQLDKNQVLIYSLYSLFSFYYGFYHNKTL